MLVETNSFKMNLQTFSEEMGEEPTGVDSEIPAAEGSDDLPEPETGVEPSDAADQKPNNYEKAFAKRLAAKEAEWQKQLEEERSKYADYDKHQKATQYLMQRGKFQDVNALAEAIEMEMLQERAQQMGITPEIAKRLEQLEEKAKLADELEQKTQQEKQYHEFRQDLEVYAKDKGVDADELHKYMFDNQIGNKEVAFKAMQADQLQQKLETAKKDAIKEYLESKKAPKVESGGTAGMTHTEPAKSFAEARQRALERFKALKNQE